MARLVLAASAEAHLDRIYGFIASESARRAVAILELIFEALQILERHPLVGRPVEDDLHELVISYGKTGYVALYSYDERDDVVMVVAFRHQREAGFHDE